MQLSEAKTNADGKMNGKNAQSKFVDVTSCEVDTVSARKTKENVPNHFSQNQSISSGEAIASLALQSDQSESGMKKTNQAFSSTPRKKKDPLSILRSNLSPKYIGFTTPPSSKADVSIRNLRRRANQTTPTDLHNVEPELLATQTILEKEMLTSPIIRKVSSNQSPLVKPYVSPIDKLLVKNGSTILNADFEYLPTGIEHKQEEIAEIVKTPEPSTTEAVDMEAFIPYNLVQECRVALDKNQISRFCEGSIFKANSIDTETAKNVEDSVNTEESKENNNNIPVYTEMFSELDTSIHEKECLSISENLVAVKSPSTVSTDSAKGSSIANDANEVWGSFSTGNLFWGQIYAYPYWPCLVCPDPEGKTIRTEAAAGGRNGIGGEQHVLIHVRFFADNGRRNWVKRENLIPYSGFDTYNKYVQEMTAKYGPKSSKCKILMPKSYKLRVWQRAIKEANIVAEVEHAERIEKFHKVYEDARALEKSNRQRRQSAHHQLESVSDIGSKCNSTDNLLSKHLYVAEKRCRSISPLSPANSTTKAAQTKRRKLSTDASSTLTDTIEFDCNDDACALSTSSPSVQSAEQTENVNFHKFYLAMKEFVMGPHTNKNIEEGLVKAVRNIWTLRELSYNDLQTRSLENYSSDMEKELMQEKGNALASVKRLSQRLKNITVRRSLGSQSSEATKTLSGEQAEIHSAEKSEPKKAIHEPIENVIDAIFALDNKYLFRNLPRGPICKYCLKPGGQLERCTKGCHTWLHADCVASQHSQEKPKIIRPSSSASSISNTDRRGSEAIAKPDAEAETISAEPSAVELVCQECKLGGEQSSVLCSVCNQTGDAANAIAVCNMQQCSKAFHVDCCRYWPQAKITMSKNNVASFRCPSHVCHTCVSDDPKGKFQHLTSAKLTKCVKCPATYHMDSTCIPAGSQLLTSTHIICPRHHSSKSDASVNVNWCFICVKGGQVVCCETCPTAVHAACLNIPIDPNEGYICEECESGRLPLYGEMVWAKFTSFRWWPAIILPPTEVPQNIERKPHNPADFVVRFFGTHDHGWISRRRVYLYLEGDCSAPPKPKSNLDLSYTRGIEEAKRVYEIIKLKKQTQSLSNESKEKLHPQPYVRIKTNRPVPPLKLHIDLEKVNRCECMAGDESPCGPDSNCLNRVLYHECNPKLCPAGERCQNQMFETRISPRLDVVYMKERGFGLVCREPLAEGSFVIEYVGEIINDKEFKQRLAQKSIDRDENFYFLSVEKDYTIDAGPKGNLARFMNHSCDPNCETQKWSVNGLNRIGLFSIKDIPADTELTFNYHWDELLGSEKKSCLCGAAKCAGQIGGKYKEEKVKDIFEIQNNQKVKHTTAKGGNTMKKLKQQKPVKSQKKFPKIHLSATKTKPNAKAAQSKTAAAIDESIKEDNIS